MDLEALRKEIEKTDLQIIDLMARRTELAEKVGLYKFNNGLPIRNVEVEKKVIDRYTSRSNESGLSAKTLEQIASLLIQEAVDKEALTVHNDGKYKISIIGGSGKMGKWIGEMFESDGNTIQIIDPACNNGLTIDDCKDSDIIVVSVPIDITGKILQDVTKICKKDAVIFDQTSLKTPFVPILRDIAKTNHICSIHPMFGPSATSMYGRNMIICDCGDEKAVEVVKELFDNRGGNLCIMPIEDHDRYMAYVLGLSHAVNIAFFTVLDRSGITYEQMQTVASTTFRKNMETNLSVALEDPMLYYEIQHMNSSRDVMWKAFEKATDDLKWASLSDDPKEFIDLMNAGRKYFTE